SRPMIGTTLASRMAKRSASQSNRAGCACAAEYMVTILPSPCPARAYANRRGQRHLPGRGRIRLPAHPGDHPAHLPGDGRERRVAAARVGVHRLPVTWQERELLEGQAVGGVLAELDGDDHGLALLVALDRVEQ